MSISSRSRALTRELRHAGRSFARAASVYYTGKPARRGDNRMPARAASSM
jgi:hypothetical protein